MPVEKLRLRPWLETMIDSARIPGVSWVERRERIFKVSWKHGSRQGWRLDKDACIFKEWAVHTGRFRESIDRPDPRRWKANFRCALNALPDIKELPARGVTRGNNAFKVYQMIQKQVPKSVQKQVPKPAEVIVPRGQISKRHVKKCLKHKTLSRATPEVWKRRTVIQKASKAPTSPLPIATSQPIKQPFFAFWPTFPILAQAHLKDHDYLTTWYDPRPEMKDIGVMTYQMPEVKEEPLSPTGQQACDIKCEKEFEDVTDSDYLTEAQENEKEIPSDEEIIDLVDRMSRDSDSLSPRSECTYEDFDPDVTQEESLVQSPSVKTKPRRTLSLKTKSDDVNEYEYSVDGATPPPLTPDSTSEILKGFASSVSQG